MKRSLIRMISLFLLLALSCFLLASCGEKPIDSRVVASNGKIKFTFDEFRYFFMNSKHDLDQGDETVWENNEALNKKLTETVMYQLKRVAAIHNLAEKYGLKINGDDEKSIKDYMKSMEDSYETEEEFQAAMESQYLSRYSLYQVLRTQYLYEELHRHVTDESNFLIRADDQALYEDIETNFYRGGQILIRNDEKDDPEANRTLADQVLEKLENGEDFFALVKEYGEDPGMTVDGYYFTSGHLLAYFEDAVKSLEVGAHTGVVECVHGYAIIKRLEKDETYIKKNLEALRDQLKTRLFDEMLEQEIDQTSIETTTLFYQMTVEQMK